MRRSTFVIVFVLVLFFAIVFGGNIAYFFTEWMWFRSLGHEQVFTGILKMRLGAGGLLGVVAMAVLTAHVGWAISRTEDRPLILPAELAESPLGAALGRISITKLAISLCALFSLILGFAGSVWWRDFMLFANGGEFGYIDPILNRDAGFYVFKLPVFRELRSYLWTLTIAGAVLSILIYLLRGAISFTFVRIDGQLVPRGVQISAPVRRHFAILAAVLIILLAVRFYLRQFGLMFERGQSDVVLAGPGFADVRWTLPMLNIQALATLAAAVAVFAAIDRQSKRMAGLGAILFFVPVVLTAVLPGVIQKVSVGPNELNREGPYLDHHIQATRFAFGLDGVDERQLPAESNLTFADIEANRATINNIRLWDHEPLLDTFAQVQEIRTYYEFQSVDNDRYMIDGELRQLMLSPRELLASSLPSRTWVNESLTYTHGYGVAAGPVNRVTSEGKPEFFVGDLPPVVTKSELAIDRPEIYFGELTQHPVYVNTESPEFDYPQSSDQGAYTKYAGTGGVSIGSFMRRLLFAIRLADSDLLLTQAITKDSKVLLRRNIMQRAASVAPFLSFDSDPYMVIAGGRLVWILDAYTHSSSFPYALASQRARGIGNYMRNSVKVTVDAYDGDVNYYIVGAADPIVAAWAKAFPNLMKPIDEMPAELRPHVRYPQTLFEVQTDLFTTFHMVDRQVFYNHEDDWNIPVVADGPMEPYYTVMKLPGEQSEEFIQMLPFTPANKDNMSAWMVARSDGDNYGGLVVYKFPKDRVIYGPKQIADLISQDEKISPQISLWDQRGSEVIQGTLLVIPIEESLIYVQPLYLRAENGRIPELKRVIVSYETRIEMEQTLEEGLAKLFDAEVAEPPGTPPEAVIAEILAPDATPGDPTADSTWQGLAVRARVHFDAAQEAARNGDWAKYGEELKALGASLESLKNLP